MRMGRLREAAPPFTCGGEPLSGNTEDTRGTNLVLFCLSITGESVDVLKAAEIVLFYGFFCFEISFYS